MPVDFFPSSILQHGLKMTTEPPRGIKSNLQRSYMSIVTQETYDEMGTAADQGRSQDNSGYVSGTNARNNDNDGASITPASEGDTLKEKQLAYKNLLYSLCFFHAVI